MAEERREATDGEKGQAENKAGSSGMSWPRRRVGEQTQVYKAIRGIVHFQGVKPIWRLPQRRPFNIVCPIKLDFNKVFVHLNTYKKTR